MHASLVLEASQSTKTFRLGFDLRISLASSVCCSADCSNGKALLRKQEGFFFLPISVYFLSRASIAARALSRSNA